MKRLMSALLLVCLLLPLCPAQAEETPETDNWNDFTWSYTNAAGEAAELQCSLYLPAEWQENHALPLITYIPDSSLVNKALNTCKRAACPANWLKGEKARALPAAMLILRFTSPSAAVTTEGGESAQIVPVVDQVTAQYGLDPDRLYLTGQSMGGIMDFALNDAFPDKFAATVYVGCQMGGEVGDAQYAAILEHRAFLGQKFVYITSRKDGKAPFGQDDVEQALLDAGVEYGKLYGLDHRGGEALEQQVQAVLDQDCSAYLFGFTQVTGTGDPAAEHMQSFKYAYAIDAIYTWLLSQHR